MTVTKGKDILSSDLDIFGESTGEDTQEQGNEFDIFGGSADSGENAAEDAGENASDEGTDADKDSTSSNTSTEAGEGDESKTGEDSDKDEDDKSGNEETLDIDIEHLFDDLEAKADIKDNPELEQLIDSLRSEISNLTTDRNVLQKENATINERLMGKVGDDASLGMYKGVISNLEANPKLMMLAKHLGNTSDSSSIKGKMVGIVADMLYDLTGEDVSDLINKDQSAKILSVTSKSANGSAPSNSSSKSNDEPMNYEDSISKLF